MAKLKTAEDVQVFADETEAKLAQFDDVMEKLKASEERNEEVKATLTEFQNKIKELTLIAKAKGSWKEQDTKEAKQYRFGKGMQNLIKGFRDPNGRGGQQAHKGLIEAGFVPVKDLGEQAPNGWEALPGFKAGASSSPLTGDDSVGSYNGSYLLPVEYESQLLRIAEENSVLMGKTTEVPMAAITKNVPKTTDRLTFTELTNQNTAKTEDNLTFAQIALTTRVFASWIAVTEEMLEDSLVPLANLIQTMYGEAWGLTYDTECLQNATYGAVNTANITSTVPVSSGAALKVAHFEEPIELLVAAGKKYDRGAEFFMSPTNFWTLNNEKDANGNYTLRAPAENAAKKMHGKVVNETEALKSKSATVASTKFGVLVNPKHIMVGKRVGFEFRVFNNTQSTAVYDQVIFRVRCRYAFKLAHAEAAVAIQTGA